MGDPKKAAPIKFVTSNPGKFQEAKAFLPGLEQVEIDLPEIQELEPQAIIKVKLEAARATGLINILVEDTSLTFEGLNGLPGPLVKWFLHGLGRDGLYKFAQSFGVKRAQAKTALGFLGQDQQIVFVEGVTNGVIVAPRGEAGFGWDGIFVPDGSSKTYAEMSTQEKLEVSHRTKALKELIESGRVITG